MRLAIFAVTFSLTLTTAGSLLSGEKLPRSTTFIGQESFQKIVAKSLRENWPSLPMGQRTIRFARELHGVPYQGYTLEIDDKIESPSANLLGLDCWTFFEISLGLARMIEIPRDSYDPGDLLREIEWTRYRGGVCNGNYLDRIHYLAEWIFEADARGIAKNITGELPGSIPVVDRKVREMTVLWKSYRYLRNTPDLLPEMGRHEARIADLPVLYVPKSRVKAIEPKLQDGDVLGIVTKNDGGFCSHVGLAIRTDDGVIRIMHASTTYKRVVIDKSVSDYLNAFRNHAGLIVARPQPRSETVTEAATYRANLKRLIDGK